MSTSSSIPIGILGSGNMGRAIGIRLAAAGHPVYFGGRSAHDAPRRAAELAGKNAVHAPQYGTLEEAAKFGEALVWTLRETDIQQVLTTAAINALRGKLIMDINNRDFASDVMGKADDHNSGPRFFERSLGEVLQEKLAPVNAHVVKVFNTIPMEHFALSPNSLHDARAQTFLADGGEEGSAEAKAVCHAIGEGLGFHVVDLGSGALAMRMSEVMGDVIRYYLSVTGKGPMSSLGFHELSKPSQEELDGIGGRAMSNYH